MRNRVQTGKQYPARRLLDQSGQKRGRQISECERTVSTSPVQPLRPSPCIKACPTGASNRAANGIVSVDYAKCIGCKTCETACPYGARTFIDKVRSYYEDVANSPYDKAARACFKVNAETSCNLCSELVAKGQEPACVAKCPEFARYFGDLNDPNSMVSKLIAQRKGIQLQANLGTDPSIYYLPAVAK